MLEQDENMKVTHEAENGQEAIDILEDNHLVDVILMDVRMPVMNGMEATREIKSRWPEIKIIILTTFNELNHGMPIHEDVTSNVIPSLMKREEKSEEIPIDLTERELAITKLVGEGKTNKEIAEELYLSIGTVKNHITTILQKLELRDRTQLAIFAVKTHLS